MYLAQDLRHNRPVALKVLHSDLAAAVGPERFQREIKLTARLQHPHILTVHDFSDRSRMLWPPRLNDDVHLMYLLNVMSQTREF